MTPLRAIGRFFRGDGLVFSGYLAFLSLLALLPVLGILFWFSQQSAIVRTADAAFRDFLFSNLIPDAAKQVMSTIEKLRANARGLGLVGIAIFAIDIVLKALALNAAFDRIWGGARRRWWTYATGAIVLLILIPAVVGSLYWFLRFLEKFFMNLFPSGCAHTPLQMGARRCEIVATAHRGGATGRRVDRNRALRHHAPLREPRAAEIALRRVRRDSGVDGERFCVVGAGALRRRAGGGRFWEKPSLAVQESSR
jgi:hypothetical protein